MVKSDANVTVSGQGEIDAVMRMTQGPYAVHCSVPEECDRITVSPLLYLLIYVFFLIWTREMCEFYVHLFSDVCIPQINSSDSRVGLIYI